MTKRLKVKSVLLTIILALLLPGIAFSQNIKIGYVDLKEVFSKFGKAKEMEENFKKEVEEEQKKISEMEKNIKKMQAEYEQKKDIMKPEEKGKKEADLREKIQEFSREWSEVNRKLDEKRKDLENVLIEEIKKDVRSYGENKGFTVILDSRVIIYGQDVINLTGEITKVINKGVDGNK